jgi:hypothetical protein
MVSHRVGDQNLLSRAPPCFGRHVKPLVLVAFAVVGTHSSSKVVDVSQAAARKIIAEFLSHHDENHVVPNPLRGIRVGRSRSGNLAVNSHEVQQ